MRTISTFIQRVLLTATALCVAATATMAQVSSYNFSQLSGTYTAITGGTVIGTTTSDDNNYANELSPTVASSTGIGFPIGFNFTFNGAIFDRFALNTNGFITLGQSALTPSTNITSSYTAISVTTTTTPPQLANRIAGFNRDLQGQTGSEMSYLTTGTAPNRVLVVQWSGFRRWNATGNNFNFQIRLYETTNVVEVVYGTFTTTETATNTAQVGLRGVNNTDFNNRLITVGTHTWATSVAGTANNSTVGFRNTDVPASGQTYRWTPANCLAPAGLAVSNVVATSADATWTTNTASGQLVIVPQGSAANTGTPVAISGTSASLPSLSPNTNYSVFVRTICGVGDTSNWSTAFNFSTPCVATNVPWSESFEGVAVTGTGGPIPSCWARNVTDFATGNGAQSQNRSARTGTKYLYTAWSSAAGTGDWAFTPGFNLTAGTSYDFSFWYKLDGLTGWDTLRVGVGGTQTSAGMSIIGTRVYSPTNMGYAEYRVTYVAPTTGVYYFGVNVWVNGTPWYITFDDFNLEASPTCPQPSAMNATAVTNASATINWTGNGQPDNYYYYFAPSPATIPAGTVGTFANTTSFNATGLTGNTSYSFFVRQYCSVGDTSSWAGPFTFSTACDPQTLGDTRANPFIVTGLSYSATGNTNSACYTNTIGSTSKDVWYHVVLDPCATTITASLCTGTSYDSYLRLYAADGTTQLAFNDDGCGAQSVITNFNIAGRDTVYVLVEGFSANVGAYTVNITQAVAPTPNADVTYNSLYCNNAANPTPTINGTTGGVFSTLTAGIALDTATGTIDIAASTLSTYDIVYTVLGTTPTCFARDTNTVQIAPLESAAFAYAANAYCNTSTNPTPAITGTSGGGFAGSSANVVVDAATGAIDLTASQTGTYDITYTTTGACFASLTRTVTLDAPQDPAFDYGVGTYCQNVGNPMPTNVATAGGVYTAPAGLAINPNTGLVILSSSATGSYMITYTTPNACAIAQTQTFVISPADDASFSFGANVFCQNVPTQQAVVTGVPFGTFSSGSGLPVDITFGLVDFSQGTTGTHTVIYATNGACPNFSIQTLLVLPADTAEFAYQGVTYCLTALNSQETPTITGNTGGTFFSTSGIDLNPTTGVFNLGAANSQAGTYTVSYVTNGPTTCRDTATATIVLEDCTTIGVTEYNSDSQESYNLYPNPNDGGFYLHNKGEFKIANLQLVDVLGRVVYSQSAATLPADAAIRIETNQLPAATYYLRITAENMQPTVLPVRVVQP
jgi:hypothetical protein